MKYYTITILVVLILSTIVYFKPENIKHQINNIPKIETNNPPSEFLKGISYDEKTFKFKANYGDMINDHIIYFYGGIRYKTENGDIMVADSCYYDTNLKRIYQIKGLKIYQK